MIGKITRKSAYDRKNLEKTKGEFWKRVIRRDDEVLQSSFFVIEKDSNDRKN